VNGSVIDGQMCAPLIGVVIVGDVGGIVSINTLLLAHV